MNVVNSARSKVVSGFSHGSKLRSHDDEGERGRLNYPAAIIWRLPSTGR
jgi:hypothetical protein